MPEGLGYSLAARGKIPKGVTVAHLRVQEVGEGGDLEWAKRFVSYGFTHFRSLAKKDYVCLPPTATAYGVLANSPASGQISNCKFGNVRLGVVPLITTRVIPQHHHLLAPYMPAGGGAVPLAPIKRPRAERDRDRACGRKRGAGGRFLPNPT